MLGSDDSIYRKYSHIVFDINISYRIVSYRQKNLKFFDISWYFYISQFFRYIAIFYAISLYFYYCITKIMRINGENNKLTEAN